MLVNIITYSLEELLTRALPDGQYLVASKLDDQFQLIYPGEVSFSNIVALANIFLPEDIKVTDYAMGKIITIINPTQYQHSLNSLIGRIVYER